MQQMRDRTGTGRRVQALWDGFVGFIAVLVGLAPHVLHHVGFLAGTFLVAGATGTILFGALGLVASVPFLIKLHRRFGTWQAPFIALLIFIAMFSVSTFVIGPAIRGENTPTPVMPDPASSEHDDHHEKDSDQ